ncbi:MAG: DUF951 domain-containing protein [Clostridia bacterium]|nr:DUF951 domain-containing protein [Clostridia bacterium]
MFTFTCFYAIIIVYLQKNVKRGEYPLNILKFDKGDTLVMKKKHPCGSLTFEVLRTGSDVRIKCTGCGHDMTIPRLKLEKNIKKVERQSGGEENV